jgi:hypothetical protein
LNATVLPVGDIDAAVLVEGDRPGLVERAIAVAGPAALADKRAVRLEDLQTVVAAVTTMTLPLFSTASSAGRISSAAPPSALIWIKEINPSVRSGSLGAVSIMSGLVRSASHSRPMEG